MTDVNPTSSSIGEPESNEKNENVGAQKITTDLRLDFLKILTQLEGKQASFNLYKRKTPSSGTFWDQTEIFFILPCQNLKVQLA